MATGNASNLEAGQNITRSVDRTGPTTVKDGAETLNIDSPAPDSPGSPSPSARETPRPAHQRLVFTDPVAFRRVRECVVHLVTTADVSTDIWKKIPLRLS